MTFNESGLEFEFDDSWVVKKYDDHRFYKRLSGAGLKAVDFIGIWKGEILALIEVKNYKIRFQDLKQLPIQNILNDPDQLARAIIKKVEDSLKAIDAIHGAYCRKWWYRLFLPFINLFKKSSADWPFWTTVHNLINDEKEIWVVFWLESEFEQETLRKNLDLTISKGLDEFTDKTFVAEIDHHPFATSIKVRFN